MNGGQQVKNAAVMIFGKSPQKFIPQLRLSLAIFSDKIVTRDFIKKNLSETLMRFIRVHL